MDEEEKAEKEMNNKKCMTEREKGKAKVISRQQSGWFISTTGVAALWHCVARQLCFTAADATKEQ